MERQGGQKWTQEPSWCNSVQDDPVWAGRLGQMSHCGPFPPYPFCESTVKLMAVTSLFFWERIKKSSQLYTLFSSVLKGDVTALHCCENKCQAREGYLVHITHCMLTEGQKVGSWSGSTQTSNQKKYPSSEKSKVLKEIHAGMPEWGGVIDLMSFKVWLDLLMTVIVLCDCLWWLRSRPWLDYSSCAVTQQLHWKGWNLQKCMKQKQCNGVMYPVYFISYSSNNPFMWLWGWSCLFFFS